MNLKVLRFTSVSIEIYLSEINISVCYIYKKNATKQSLKTYTNKQTGERMTAEVAKRVREWFWVSNTTGKINLAIKYGAKTLSLNKKGANAIELTNGDELIATLKELKIATANGEFDEAITEVSEATRQGFGK